MKLKKHRIVTFFLLLEYQKFPYYRIPFIKNAWKDMIIEMENKLVVARG